MRLPPAPIRAASAHQPSRVSPSCGTLIVMAKSPVAGLVKTRLTPQFTPGEAAALAQASLRDTLDTVLAAPARRRVVAWEGPVRSWVAAGIEVIAQQGERLDERISHALQEALHGPAPGPALLVGMDTPQLRAGQLTKDLPAMLAEHNRLYDKLRLPAARLTLRHRWARLVFLFANVPVFDGGGRAATTTFAQRSIGDALCTFESEVNLIKAEFGDNFEVVYPKSTILAENPVAVIDRVVDKKGTRKQAEAYLKFLWGDEAQEIAAKHQLRPRSAALLAKYSKDFPKVQTFTIDEYFGGWTKAQREHFDDGATFDQILSAAKK